MVVKQSDLTVGETPRSRRDLQARERTNSVIKEAVIRDVRHSVNYVDEDLFVLSRVSGFSFAADTNAPSKFHRSYVLYACINRTVSKVHFVRTKRTWQ